MQKHFFPQSHHEDLFWMGQVWSGQEAGTLQPSMALQRAGLRTGLGLSSVGQGSSSAFFLIAHKPRRMENGC